MTRAVAAIACLGIGVTGCADVPTTSTPCTRMCTAATELYGDCLSDWGLDWSSAGFADAAGHQESCEVWAWQTTEVHGSETIDAICDERRALFHNGACSDYASIDWDNTP